MQGREGREGERVLETWGQQRQAGVATGTDAGNGGGAHGGPSLDSHMWGRGRESTVLCSLSSNRPNRRPPEYRGGRGRPGVRPHAPKNERKKESVSAESARDRGALLRGVFSPQAPKKERAGNPKQTFHLDLALGRALVRGGAFGSPEAQQKKKKKKGAPSAGGAPCVEEEEEE